MRLLTLCSTLLHQRRETAEICASFALIFYWTEPLESFICYINIFLHILQVRSWVGYENHKPYLRTPYLNPYQNFSALLERNQKTQSHDYWCHIKTLCIINICYKYKISELPIFEENDILVFLGV